MMALRWRFKQSTASNTAASVSAPRQFTRVGPTVDMMALQAVDGIEYPASVSEPRQLAGVGLGPREQ